MTVCSLADFRALAQIIFSRCAQEQAQLSPKPVSGCISRQLSRSLFQRSFIVMRTSLFLFFSFQTHLNILNQIINISSKRVLLQRLYVLCKGIIYLLSVLRTLFDKLIIKKKFMPQKHGCSKISFYNLLFNFFYHGMRLNNE